MAKNGYWVVCYKSVSNPPAISEYAKLAASALEALGGRVIVAGKPAKTHEAGVDQSVVVVEFENLERRLPHMKVTCTGQRSTYSTRPRRGIFVLSKDDDPVESRESFATEKLFLGE